MKTTIRSAAALLATTLIAAAVLSSALPDTANAAAESNGLSLATAPLARGAGYELVNGSPRVRHLQRQLRRLGQRPGPIDGLFGPLTEGAVRRFQHGAGLVPDGFVGPKTATHLARRMAAIRRSALERDRLARGRQQFQRSVTNDRRSAFDIGVKPAPAHASGTSSTARLLVGLLMAFAVAPAFVLLATRARKSRTTDMEAQRDDLPEPVEAQPTPAVERLEATPSIPIVVPPVPLGLDELSEPAAQNGAGAAGQAPQQNGDEIAQAPPARPAAERGLAPGVPVIGYVSVSEDERLALGAGYATQAEAIETFCRRRGLRLLRVVRDVENAGRRGSDAPGLQHACQALARGEARALVVHELRHLTRSPARLSLLLRWLADVDRILIAIGTELDTSTVGGRKIARALIEVGDWDRQRAAESRARKRVKGGGAGPPSVRDLPDLHRRIAAMREEGLSLHAIADTLNAEGVPTLRGGARWRASSVQAAVGYKRPKTRDMTGGLTLPTPPRATADEEAGR